MELIEKLKILSDSARYDASCSSSGGVRMLSRIFRRRQAQQLSFFDGSYDYISPPAEEKLSAISDQL